MDLCLLWTLAELLVATIVLTVKPQRNIRGRKVEKQFVSALTNKIKFNL